MTVSVEKAQHSLPDLIAGISPGGRVTLTLNHKPVAELRSVDTTTPIMKTAGVVGGDACIRMTRIPVWTLVQMKKLGRHEAELIEDFPGLTPSDLDAAWDYYRANTGEIDQAIAAEVSNVGDLRGQLLRVRRPAS
jgi:uncharacterized protein (DUF433 family)